MKTAINKSLITLLKVVISFAALYFVFTKIDVSQLISIYKDANHFWVVMAVLSFALSKSIAAFRLNRFFTSIDIHISEIQNLKLYLLGMFYNLFLPGGIGGDGYKIFILNKKFEVRTKNIFWSVLADRMSGVYALFSLSVILLYIIKIEINFNYLSVVWLLIPLGLFFFYFILKKFASFLNKVLIKTTLLSFLVQLMQLVSAYFILKALGVEEFQFRYLFIFLISSIVAMLPISIGGMGLRELTFLYGSQFLFLDEGSSVGISLMFYLITAFVSLTGIYYSIRTERIEI
ncbi:MAG: flippase-like domain-containing protein [Bacteroidales bacterium]|nr:flippase-like domain-containing protein [Bacteroidales bacterium]MCF8391162.1 flippase-like domain-containing protein [Bacteroidales bacterium]